MDVEEHAGSVTEIESSSSSSSSNRFRCLSSSSFSLPPSAALKLSCRNANSSMRLSSTSSTSTVELEAVADLLLLDGSNFWDGRKGPYHQHQSPSCRRKLGRTRKQLLYRSCRRQCLRRRPREGSCAYYMRRRRSSGRTCWVEVGNCKSNEAACY